MRTSNCSLYIYRKVAGLWAATCPRSYVLSFSAIQNVITKYYSFWHICGFRDQELIHFYALDLSDNIRHWRTTQENVAGFKRKLTYQINTVPVVKTTSVRARNNKNCWLLFEVQTVVLCRNEILSLSLGEECNLISEVREQGSKENILAYERVDVKCK